VDAVFDLVRASQSALTEAGITTTDEEGRYQLTDLGNAPEPALEPLQTWAARWAATIMR
jgi:DNA-binding HxlR family transcriptional regulator